MSRPQINKTPRDSTRELRLSELGLLLLLTEFIRLRWRGRARAVAERRVRGRCNRVKPRRQCGGAIDYYAGRMQNAHRRAALHGRPVPYGGAHEAHGPYADVLWRPQRQHSNDHARCGRAQPRVAHARRRAWRYVVQFACGDSGARARGAGAQTARAAARGQGEDGRSALVVQLQLFGLQPPLPRRQPDRRHARAGAGAHPRRRPRIPRAAPVGARRGAVDGEQGARATSYARVKGAENEEPELADDRAEAKQRDGVNNDWESVALEKCSGLRQNLRDVEKARLDSHHEHYGLRRCLGSLGNERT